MVHDLLCPLNNKVNGARQANSSLRGRKELTATLVSGRSNANLAQRRRKVSPEAIGRTLGGGGHTSDSGGGAGSLRNGVRLAEAK